MAQGLKREQVGVTEEMIASFGETVFRMSHNWQVREGDPVRMLDWAEIERQREGMGLSDGQIAERIGLTPKQVMFIRNTEESRRFRTGQTAYLLELGGGKRFRPDRTVRLEERFRFSPAALRLRAALRFDPQRVQGFVRNGWWNGDTLSGWLARHAATRPDSAALVEGERTMTWRQLAERVSCCAEGLRRSGVARGDVVAVQLPNVAEFAIAYLAICRLGAVMSTLHMPYRGAELETLLRHSGAVAAICLAQAKDWSPAETIRGLGEKLPALKTVLTLEDLAGFRARLDDAAVPAPVAGDPFLLLYTSGTTSSPKGVPHASHAMLSNARLGVAEHRISARDRVLSAAPFTHLFGLYALHVAWSAGAASVLLPVFTPTDLAACVERDKPTALWTAPAHIAACRATGLLDKHDFGSLELAIMSGSTCPPELVRWFQSQVPRCAVTQLWGMTETQAGLYTRPGDPIEVAAGSAGRASPGTEVRVAGTDDAVRPANEEGELQTRGCALFAGYFDNAEANAAAFTADGWFRTGDLARMDAQGNVAITGRIKDVINRGGVKFNPRDVEELLDAHPKIQQSAIVPMPDAVLGERSCCFAVLRPGTTGLELDEVVDWLAGRGIARLKLPERLVILAEMPLTPTRKVIKGRLRLPDQA